MIGMQMCSSRGNWTLKLKEVQETGSSGKLQRKAEMTQKEEEEGRTWDGYKRVDSERQSFVELCIGKNRSIRYIS